MFIIVHLLFVLQCCQQWMLFARPMRSRRYAPLNIQLHCAITIFNITQNLIMERTTDCNTYLIAPSCLFTVSDLVNDYFPKLNYNFEVNIYCVQNLLFDNDVVICYCFHKVTGAFTILPSPLRFKDDHKGQICASILHAEVINLSQLVNF